MFLFIISLNIIFLITSGQIKIYSRIILNTLFAGLILNPLSMLKRRQFGPFQLSGYAIKSRMKYSVYECAVRL